MANGHLPSEPPEEEYVLRSGVRAGLKREFVFAMKAQAELPSLLGRTRSGNSKPVYTLPRATKKQKKSSDGSDLAEKQPEPSDPVPIPPSTPSPIEAPPSTPSPIEAEAPNVMDGLDEPMGKANPLEIEPTVEIGDKVKDVGISACDKPIDDEARSPMETPSVDVKPLITYSRSVSKAKDDVATEREGSNAMDGLDEAETKSILPENGDKAANEEAKSLMETPFLGNKPLRTYSRSVSKTKGDVAKEKDRTCSMHGPDVPIMEANPLENKSTTEIGDEAKPSMESRSAMEPPVVTDKPLRRFTRSVLKAFATADDVAKEESMADIEYGEKPMEINGSDKPMDTPVVSDKLKRRFTRSLLNATSDNVADVAKEEKGVVTEEKAVETPNRRFTRSLLNNKEKGEESGESDSGPKKNLELKMSKMIALTKPPGNIRELLATGLLEGLPVKYSIPTGKLPVLHGVIKGINILCSCPSCNSCRAISPFNFEVHAGSNKKHPSDFIYLENGKNLRDILRTCANVPLHLLESAIHSAIGQAPEQKTYTCRKCKGSFVTTRTGKFASLCNPCLEPKYPLNTPSKSSLTPGSSSIRKTRSGPTKPHKSASKNASLAKKANTIGRLTRKDLGLHKLVFMNGILPSGTEVGYYVRGKRLLVGYIKDSGIFCNCCETVVSPSQFEAHAGRAARRKPYNNIYTSNGVSLHELSVSLSKGRKRSASQNDDLCSICADGGNLLLCDLCPRAFHKECVGMTNIPKGDWYCKYCESMQQREGCVANNSNAIAAGRVAGVDPIEQIFKRCIRIVTTSETYIGGCSLCKLHDFSRSKFDDRTVLLCDQCEKEYHVGCLKEHNMADLKELPEGEWFCCEDCSRVHGDLQDLLTRGAQLVSPSDLDIVNRKLNEMTVEGREASADLAIEWRLLSGKKAGDEGKLLLSKAVSIFHESFDPIVEATTGRDLIPAMVYGRTVRDQDYSGMYCAVLTAGSSVVSAGLLRVMGRQAAELPLVATSRDSQGKGYFQVLFGCIERLLASLNVKHFVLPAADEAESIWTNKFAFHKISSDQLQDYLNGTRTTIFQGTSILHKPVSLSS